MVLAAFQQRCGINVIFYYAEEVFKAAGYTVSAIMLNMVYTGAIMLGAARARAPVGGLSYEPEPPWPP